MDLDDAQERVTNKDNCFACEAASNDDRCGRRPWALQVDRLVVCNPARGILSVPSHPGLSGCLGIVVFVPRKLPDARGDHTIERIHEVAEMLTERDLFILEYLYRYYCLSRAQLGRLCFPNDSGGRVTRRRLQMLVDAGLIRRMPILLTNPLASSNASQGSVYYPALRGLEVLAEHRGDQRVLAGTTRTPQMHRLSHWLAVSETHMALDAAIASQNLVTCPCFYNEWDTVNAEETLPEKRFRLYLLLEQKPRLVCAPDAAFLLEVGTLRKAFYLEQDLATSSVPQVAASKTKGYAVMAERGLHRKHFPEENVGAFSVLLVTRSRHRREALKSAFRGKPGAALWRFAAEEDLTPEKVLFEPIFHPCEGHAVPLIKTPPMPRAADAADVAAENSETQQNA